METIKSPAEQKVILHNVSWGTYERLMDERGESRVPRFAFDRGKLEIMSPQAEHESISYATALLIEVLAEEMDVDVYGLGSTTFKREDLGRGFEPDQCFYIKDRELVRAKERLDLAIDPPPELVVEIDITSPSLNKLPIYARLGIREVWRYDEERMRILGLEDDGYVERPASLALPTLTNDVLTRFAVEGAKRGRRVWMREVREWAQGHALPSN
ncbi:MAG: Uma2 family endonuclease [Actinomycetota bacterium]|nr:Uma2 family endonuclease [Actinomycetota bacterium]